VCEGQGEQDDRQARSVQAPLTRYRTQTERESIHENASYAGKQGTGRFIMLVVD
jgi:hypothetical protein